MKKVSAVSVFTKMTGKASAAEGRDDETEPKSPLSPAQRFKKEKAEQELSPKDLA